MILICKNYDENNESHQEVIDWLRYKNAEICFSSGHMSYQKGSDWSIELNDTETKTNIPNEGIKAVWFRGFLNHRSHLHDLVNDIDSTNDNVGELRWRMGQEIAKINSQLFSNFRNTYQLPKISSLKIDKFAILKKAKKEGLSIPNSLITNSKKELLKFIEKNDEIITKPLYEIPHFIHDYGVSVFKTGKIDASEIIGFPETFFPSFFQQYVEKDIELRVFYIEKKFFPMAIFSQLDEQTKVDFRNYNSENPNRSVPYKLSKDIENKLINLMESLDLNTGSIDLIKGIDGKYVFLEVNPIGQFGFTSKPCNYYLEEEIANALMKPKYD